MAVKRTGLGKGLDSMIPPKATQRAVKEDKNTVSKTGETILKINEVEPNKKQPRKFFNEEALQELSDSIKQHGIVQPLVVAKKDDYFEIIAGERRWRAAKLAGLKEVPVVIKDYSPQEIMEVALIENIQREDLNPVEEAKAYQNLIKEYNLKQEEVAERVSKSRSAITNSLRLLKLSDDVLTLLMEEEISSGHARALLGLEDSEKQLEIAENINAKADEIEGYVAEIITASREDFLSLDVNMGEFYLSELVTKIKLYYTEKLSLIKTDFFVGEYGDCLISGDFDRSVEVVQNIMENAIKYGDGKEISISFSEEEGCILIAVKNSGCTLPDTDLPHIFESFWRGANAENLKGSGLGLYICRQLMHKMNGEVFAQIKGGDMCVTAVFGKTSCDMWV